MGDWYTLGIAVGVGVAAGVGLAGVLAARRGGPVAATVIALGVGAAAGYLIEGWIGLPGGSVGALVGAISAAVVVRGAMRRGAMPFGTALLLGAAALVLAAVALVPVAGYLIALLVPGAAARRARQDGERFAGLRTLAK